MNTDKRYTLPRFMELLSSQYSAGKISEAETVSLYNASVYATGYARNGYNLLQPFTADNLLSSDKYTLNVHAGDKYFVVTRNVLGEVRVQSFLNSELFLDANKFHLTLERLHSYACLYRIGEHTVLQFSDLNNFVDEVKRLAPELYSRLMVQVLDNNRS